MEKAHSDLASGHFTSKWTSNELCFTYFLWFEDFSGNLVKPQSDSLQLPLNPSVLCNGFEDMVMTCFPSRASANKTKDRKKSVYTYELLYIQTTSHPKGGSDGLMEAKRLAAKLWEVTSLSNIEAFGL
jgi:hypothetical protein